VSPSWSSFSVVPLAGLLVEPVPLQIQQARQNRATAGRGDDTTRRRDRVRARGCGPGLEGHRREPARGSWDVAQWAGNGKTQVTRQDRASCGLDISNE
jgi:hypothetical protein